MTDRVEIAGLNIYPVKACRGIARETLKLAATGFERDRHWMIVRPTGRFVTQRDLPRLALIETAVFAGGLRLAAPGMPEIEVEERTADASRDVVVWRDTCLGIDQGEPVAVWLTRFLGVELRLVAFDGKRERVINPQWTGTARAITEFSDAFAILAISEASLVDLNTRLARPLPMERFRTNVVLAGIGPYEEDRIDELRRDGVRLRFVKPCIRCSVTTTNQATGVVEGDEPLRTLKTYRWSKELSGIMFGQNAIVIDGVGRELKVGEQLDVIWRT
jgi:uncharacterized protein YcbX